MTHSLGQRVREFRTKNRMTQADLAQGLCTPSMISQIEGDRAKPSFKMLVALSDRLQVPMERLLEDVSYSVEQKSKFVLAQSMIQAERYEMALALLKELAAVKYGEVSEDEVQYLWGICALQTGRLQEAEDKFLRICETAAAHEGRELHAKALLALADLAVIKKETPLAIYHTERALCEAKKAERVHPGWVADIQVKLASLHQLVGRIESATACYREALETFQNASDLRGLGQTYLELADSYQKQGDFEKSQQYAAQALSVFKRIGDQEKLLDTECQLVLLEREEQAEEAQAEAVTVKRLLAFAAIYEQQADTERAGQVYADIARVCFEQERSDHAQEYAEKAMLFLPHEHPAMGGVHRVLADVYRERGEEASMLQHLDFAATVYEQAAQLDSLEEVTMQLCHHLIEQGCHKEAFDRMEQMHEFMKRKLEERGILI
jgi:HTH-type transcriptional regulator, quorum sensing regulator NprR